MISVLIDEREFHLVIGKLRVGSSLVSFVRFFVESRMMFSEIGRMGCEMRESICIINLSFLFRLTKCLGGEGVRFNCFFLSELFAALRMIVFSSCQ